MFVDGVGSGTHAWPASLCLAAYLGEGEFSQLDSLQGNIGQLANSNGKQPFWHGCTVLELGCGVGLVSVLLARLGAHVLATDVDDEALMLAKENATHHQVSGKLQFLRLDWMDTNAVAKTFANTLERIAPASIDLLVAADCVISGMSLGPMWHASAAKHGHTLGKMPPGPLLEATRVLSGKETQVVLAVCDRADEVKETARALIGYGKSIEMLSMPRDFSDGGSCVVTIFHFRWH